MADDSKESRTEEATEKKIGDELERGNAPFSKEATLFASVSAMLIIGAFFAQQCIAAITLLLRHLFDDAGGVRLRNGNDAIALMKLVSWDVFKVLIAPLVIFAAAGVLSSAFQNAPRLVVDRILPNFKRISLSEGWQRLHGARGYAEFSKSVLKLISIGVIVFTVLQSQQNKLVSAMPVEPEALPELILSIAMKLMSVVCIVTAALLAIDLVWSRFHWRRDMRMTRQEFKDEMKQNDGDPVRKARLRSLAQDRVRKNMIAAVPKATLVIANPTHYAIALRYVKEEGGAPLVISKGQDLIALKIRELAERHSIPIIEDKLLARSMYDSVEVDHPIPAQFYKAVAELIHYLYSKSAASSASR